jgi:multisubunit Na+/H+ antiporter MnhB subunit
VRRSLIVDTTVRVVFPAVVVLSLYFLFAGHNQPGGGFVGGLVLGAGLALRFVAGGLPEVRGTFAVPASLPLGVGLSLAAGTAIVPLLFGDAPLESAKAAVDVPVLGTVNFTSVLAFDAGVYLVVVGLVMAIVESYGQEPIEQGGS